MHIRTSALNVCEVFDTPTAVARICLENIRQELSLIDLQNVHARIPAHPQTNIHNGTNDHSSIDPQ